MTTVAAQTPNLKALSLEDVARHIREAERKCVVISSINFEECSIAFSCNLMTLLSSEHVRNVEFHAIRLYSKRASPRSALELVKERHHRKLVTAAEANRFYLEVHDLEHPVTRERALEAATKAFRLGEENRTVILDISAMPRDLGTYLCDIVCGLCEGFMQLPIVDLFVVVTPPEETIGRKALGPFTLGMPKCVYKPELIQSHPSNTKLSMLLFPGEEGFEARSAIDTIAGHNAQIFLAIDVFGPPLGRALNKMIANQSVLTVAFSSNYPVRYCYSPSDALRVALAAVDEALKMCQALPLYRHAFLVAAFGAKWEILVGTLARREFQRRCQQGQVQQHTHDVVVLPISQYVSLYSRGSSNPIVFQVSLKH